VRTVSGGPCRGGDAVTTPKPESMAELAASYALDRAALRLQYDALVAENARLREALQGLMWRFEDDDTDPHAPEEKAPDILAARAALEPKP
jgi:hypothetical protein